MDTDAKMDPYHGGCALSIESNLFCSLCEDWKPPGEFTQSKGYRHRANRHYYCKACRAMNGRIKRGTLPLEVAEKSETSGIVSPAVRLLNQMPGVLAIRINSGGYRGRTMGAPAGTADIFAVADGQTFFFEAKKNDKEKLSPEQKKFSDRALRAGARFFVIYGKTQPKEIIDEWRKERQDARIVSNKLGEWRAEAEDR